MASQGDHDLEIHSSEATPEFPFPPKRPPKNSPGPARPTAPVLRSGSSVLLDYAAGRDDLVITDHGDPAVSASRIL